MNLLHDLEDFSCFECCAGMQDHWGGHVSGLDTNHVWVLVVAKVLDFSRLFDPRIPYDCGRESEEKLYTIFKQNIRKRYTSDIIPVSGKLYFWILIFRLDTTLVMMCS